MAETATLREGEHFVVKLSWKVDPRPYYTIGKIFMGDVLVWDKEYSLDSFDKEWCRINAHATGWQDMSTLADAPACQPILLRYELRGKERYEIVYKSLGGDISYPPTPQRLGWMMLSDNLGEAIL